MNQSGFDKFDGDYNDYADAVLLQTKEKPKKAEAKVNLYKLRKERDSEMNKLRGRIKRLEEEIDRLDGEISELNGQLSTPEVSADYEKVLEFTNKINELTEIQLALMEEWEEWNHRLAELMTEE
jgi:ATP-binding cassette subfamily F protein 3